MGPPPDAENLLGMLENPQFVSTMNEALQNPAVIDMMIQQNPMLRDMGPGVRQMMQSPEFRRMLTDPSNLRHAMQMQRAMGGGAGGMGGGNAFPAPGVTNTTPEENRGAQDQNGESGAAPTPGVPPLNPFMMPPGLGAGNPFAALFGGNPMGANPSNPAGDAQPSATPGATGGDGAAGTNGGEGQNQQAAQNPFGLFNPALFGQQGAGQAGHNPFNPQQNPFLRDPALFQQMMQAMGGPAGDGGAAAGANPFASLFGGGGFGSPAPPDNRPPEERYAEQLRQLNDMGFFEFERNIEALRRSGGSVQGAVEYLLGNPS